MSRDHRLESAWRQRDKRAIVGDVRMFWSSKPVHECFSGKLIRGGTNTERRKTTIRGANINMAIVERTDSRERKTRRLRWGRIGDKVIVRRQAHQLLFHQINQSLAARPILHGMLFFLGVPDLVTQPKSRAQPYTIMKVGCTG